MKNKNSRLQEDIIQKIKMLRIKNGISQLALSNILEISSGQIGNIESPKFQHKYTLNQIYKFCLNINYPFERIFLSEQEILSTDYTELLIKKIIEYDK